MSGAKAGSAERRARISMVLFLSHHCCHIALYDMYLISMTQFKVLLFASWCTFRNLKPAVLKAHDLYSDVTAWKCKHGYGDAVLFHVEFHVMQVYDCLQGCHHADWKKQRNISFNHRGF